MEPLAAAALLFCSTAQPGPYPPASAVVDAFVEAYNNGDAQAVAALVTSKAVVTRGDQQLRGAQMVKNYRDNLFKIRPLVRLTVGERLAQDDLVAQSETYRSQDEPDETMLAFYRVDHGCIVALSASDAGESVQD